MSPDRYRTPADRDDDSPRVVLTSPQDKTTLVELLRHRKSTKAYQVHHVSLGALSRLLHTAVSSAPNARRPYGSAHARYGVMITVVAAAVEGLTAGAYRYLPGDHTLAQTEDGDHRSQLARGTRDAPWLMACPVVLVLSADLAAASKAFDTQEPGRGEGFCWLEAGMIAQNIYLWAAENALGTVFLGGLDPSKTHLAAHRLIPPAHTVLGLLPIGHPAAVPT